LEFSENTVTYTANVTGFKNLLHINPAKLQFPLTLRAWKAGDRIRLLGMKGTKKVSDVLIDAKVPRHHKAQVWVLESGGEIVWVIGYKQTGALKNF